jgi:hypothetical protein
MNAPEKPEGRVLPPLIARWGFVIVGGGVLIVPIEAIMDGRILGLGSKYHHAGAILRSDEPRLFWFTVAAFVAFSLVFISIGIFKGGRDA